MNYSQPAITPCSSVSIFNCEQVNTGWDVAKLPILDVHGGPSYVCEKGRSSQFYLKEALTQMFFCEYCEIFKNTYFEEDQRTEKIAKSGKNNDK